MVYHQYPLSQGSPYPLGSYWDGQGVNFSLFSAHATQIEICIFDHKGQVELKRIPMHWRTGDIWHCYIRGLSPGTVYGYRVYGAYDPQNGHRFNPHKLLLDPYAKQICDSYIWHSASYGFSYKDGDDLSFDKRDNSPYVPKAVVVSEFNITDDFKRPYIPKEDMVIYEAHVKGLTALHPDIPENLRGTFMGMSHPSVIQYLKNLGVTSIELLPVFLLAKHDILEKRGLSNYWGYDPINYFTLDPRFGVSDVRTEFHHMVRSYHEAGLEIILDVVYNHTGESNEHGPTYSFKGIDNTSYYALDPQNARYYQNSSGCGNILDLSNFRVNQMVMDSLRYWVEQMGVDGFRFDLATSLLRDGYGYIPPKPHFFSAITQDPILNRAKLIAEPWDLGIDGWQTGRFPSAFSEWNDFFRDTVRNFWNSSGTAASFSGALSGSSHLFNHNGRRPQASINFITAHDGFTLRDLVSYNKKHNKDNKEDNRDGNDNNRSFNYGVEGPTEDKEIRHIRHQQMRNLMASLILSEGIPMILAGDEYGRSQKGNNNAWCQDNEISWLRWDRSEEEKHFYEFTRMLILYRRYHPVFRRIHFFDGKSEVIEGAKDVVWLSPLGHEMLESEWHGCKCFGAYLPGDTGLHEPYGGKPILDDRFLVLFNATSVEKLFKITPGLEKCQWSLVFDTARIDIFEKTTEKKHLSKGDYLLKPHSMVMWRERKSAGDVEAIWNKQKEAK